MAMDSQTTCRFRKDLDEEEAIEFLEERGFIVLRKEDLEDLELEIYSAIQKFLREKGY